MFAMSMSLCHVRASILKALYQDIRADIRDIGDDQTSQGPALANSFDALDTGLSFFTISSIVDFIVGLSVRCWPETVDLFICLVNLPVRWAH